MDILAHTLWTNAGARGASKIDDDEKKKILCGEKHFEAIGANFALAVKSDLSDLQ
jgi:hypothetical protein